MVGLKICNSRLLQIENHPQWNPNKNILVYKPIINSTYYDFDDCRNVGNFQMSFFCKLINNIGKLAGGRIIQYEFHHCNRGPVSRVSWTFWIVENQHVIQKV